ncbi:MAG: ribosome silencing factor [Anaerolineaceae bacterium]
MAQRCHLDGIDFAKTVVDALEEKKAENILLLDIKDISAFTDYFVIAEGSSDRMLDSLSTATMTALKKKHGLSSHTEGYARDGWILIDAGDVVIHLFSPDQRNYYRLEELWSQGKILLRLQ